MHRTDLSPWRHAHRFTGDTSAAEAHTRWVLGITLAMMAVEITTGMLFNSMALLADGWHMGTHAMAFLIAVAAYAFSRRKSDDPHYSFGTGKMGVLSGFASAVLLAVVSAGMAFECFHRLLAPVSIHFNQAILVCVLGLLVNLACAAILGSGAPHAHHHGHSPGAHGHHEHKDLNITSAYLHVLADAATSVTAIIALAAGKYLGWNWMDPLMGVLGSALIASWSWKLLQETGGILLDRIPDTSDLPEVIRRDIEADGDSKVADLHIWQVSAGKFAAIVSIVANNPPSAEVYRTRLNGHEELVHTTIEIRRCPGPD
jgi:cation diffusion facilitator family transporter